MGEQFQKNNSSLFDYFIVGQGIAGSVLALQLIEKGYTVCVINNSTLSKSSYVAAGIWNPVVFKRLTKSWMADDIIPSLNDFYKKSEILFNTSLITYRNIIKPFTEKQEELLWLKKSETENNYLQNSVFENYQLTHEIKISSYSNVLEAGNINLHEFLNQTKKYLIDNFSYLDEEFLFSDLEITDEKIKYKNFYANRIIFCEGHLISKNPYFNWLPFKPAKGEVLTIYCENLNLENDILNKGKFIMPLGNNTYKFGATYEWTNFNDEPTEKGLSELEEKLKTLINLPYTILKHEAGVRPSVIDRRPVIGCHPKFKNIFVFNGLGTKGVMLAPYFANQFVENLKNGTKLQVDVDISRFST